MMNYKYIIYIIIIIIIIIIYDIIKVPLKRYFLTKKLYDHAVIIAKNKNKKLLIIGDPCSGHMIKSLGKYFPNSGHGDVTIDLYGCDKCHKIDINNNDELSQFETNKYVILEIGTISYSKCMPKTLKQLNRNSGGDLLSSGGTNGYIWRNYGYKLYDDELNYIIYPYDFRKNKKYRYNDLKDNNCST